MLLREAFEAALARRGTPTERVSTHDGQRRGACVRHTLVEVDLSKPVHRGGLAAIGTIDVIDSAFGLGAAQDVGVIDVAAPCVRFDNVEFARTAKAALRDEFSHALVLFGQEDGKNPRVTAGSEGSGEPYSRFSS